MRIPTPLSPSVKKKINHNLKRLIIYLMIFGQNVKQLSNNCFYETKMKHPDWKYLLRDFFHMRVNGNIIMPSNPACIWFFNFS